MKKLFSLVAAVCVAAMAHAGLGLSVNGQAVSADTEITITEVENDDFTGDAVMGWKGTMFYSGNLTVYIERETPCIEDHEDQLCAGSCLTGTAGQAKDTMNFNLGMYPPPVQVYAHYYPQSGGVETIKYHFVGGDDDFTLTVHYDSREAMAVETVKSETKATKQVRDGRVVIVREDKVYDMQGKQLTDKR